MNHIFVISLINETTSDTMWKLLCGSKIHDYNSWLFMSDECVRRSEEVMCDGREKCIWTNKTT